jgi:uncharacterized OB-fold protein
VSGDGWQEHLRCWRCAACGALSPYAEAVCTCGGRARSAALLSGSGRIHSHTTAAGGPAGATAVVLVESAETPAIRFLAAWRRSDAPAIGAPVVLDSDASAAVPVVVPAGGSRP